MRVSKSKPLLEWIHHIKIGLTEQYESYAQTLDHHQLSLSKQSIDNIENITQIMQNKLKQNGMVYKTVIQMISIRYEWNENKTIHPM